MNVKRFKRTNANVFRIAVDFMKIPVIFDYIIENVVLY